MDRSRSMSRNTSSRSTSRSRSRERNAGDDTALDAFVHFLNQANVCVTRYNWQYKIIGDAPLYDGIGALEGLLGMSSHDTWKVLEGCSLVRTMKVANRRKQVIMRKEWTDICYRLDGVSIDTKATRKEALVIRLGKGNDIPLDVQLNERMQPPRILSNLVRLQRKFQNHTAISAILDSNCPETTINSDMNMNTSANTGVARRNSIDNGDLIADEAQQGPQRQQKRKAKMRYTDVNGIKAHVPNGYKVVHKCKLNSLEEKKNIADAIKSGAAVGDTKYKRLSEIEKTILGTLASMFPQSAEVTTEQMLCGGGLLLGMKLNLTSLTSFDCKVPFDEICKTLPSRTTINSCVKTVAAHKIIYRGIQMVKAQKVFLACDKGAGVLVKMAFFYNEETDAIVQCNLDFDKSGDDAVGGGVAIRESIRKYTFDVNDPVKFDGSGADSGGGFTKEAMVRNLKAVNVLRNPDGNGHIHINCTTHNDQTNLRVAMLAAYGSGGLKERNALQTVHSYADVQTHLDGTEEIQPLLRAAWRHINGDRQAPTEYLSLMQEPILTRWYTVGKAMRYVQQYLSVCRAFCKGICGSKSRKASHSVHLAASNFRSLTNEEEIVIDINFIADFDRCFFENHLDFNHATDEHLGKSGFLARHHLVRYYIKETELETIIAEVNAGATSPISIDAMNLRRFWQQMEASTNAAIKEKCLLKAKLFLDEYKKSMHYHHQQWVDPSLLHFGAFGEYETGRIVARLLLKRDRLVVDDMTYTSKIHEKKIHLNAFAAWVQDKTGDAVADAASKTINFEEVKEAIEDIADGFDIWSENTNLLSMAHKDLFKKTNGAIPSTMIMVERSVKKAKLCQQTGKGERSVTAYGIAGDGVSEHCTSNLVASTYVESMQEERKLQIAKAETDGKTTRFKGEYKQDIGRGAGMTINLCNHAIRVAKQAAIAKQWLGEDIYDARLKQTINMLTDLESTGSYDRHNSLCEEFETGMLLSDDVYTKKIASKRELETGVTDTPQSQGEIPLGKLLKNQNEAAVLQECVARGLVEENNPDKMNWTSMLKLIKRQVREEWIAVHPGEAIPDDVGKSFKPKSSAIFVVRE